MNKCTAYITYLQWSSKTLSNCLHQTRGSLGWTAVISDVIETCYFWLSRSTCQNSSAARIPRDLCRAPQRLQCCPADVTERCSYWLIPGRRALTPAAVPNPVYCYYVCYVRLALGELIIRDPSAYLMIFDTVIMTKSYLLLE